MRLFVLLEQGKIKHSAGDCVKRGIFEGIVITANLNSFVLECFQSNIGRIVKLYNNDVNKVIIEHPKVWFVND